MRADTHGMQFWQHVIDDAHHHNVPVFKLFEMHQNTIGRFGIDGKQSLRIIVFADLCQERRQDRYDCGLAADPHDTYQRHRRCQPEKEGLLILDGNLFCTLLVLRINTLQKGRIPRIFVRQNDKIHIQKVFSRYRAADIIGQAHRPQKYQMVFEASLAFEVINGDPGAGFDEIFHVLDHFTVGTKADNGHPFTLEIIA